MDEHCTDSDITTPDEANVVPSTVKVNRLKVELSWFADASNSSMAETKSAKGWLTVD